MKIKLLTSLVLRDKSYGVGEIVEIKDSEAYSLVINKLADPVEKKKFAELKQKIEEEKKKKKEEEKLLKAKLEKEKIEAELNALYEQVIEKEALLAGVSLTDKEKFKLIEELKNREVKVEAKNNK